MEATREITLSSGTIRIRESGPKDGPVLFFIHGFMVDGRLWRKVVAEVDGWARCIAPDLPFGSHTIPMNDDADLSGAGVARLMAELLEALDVSDVTVIGNDTGGAMTQVLVTEHPDRIGRMVLTSCDAFEAFPPKLFVPIVRVGARGPAAVMAMLAPMRVAAMRRTPLGYGFTSKHGIPDDVTEAWVTPALTDRAIRRDIAKLCRHIKPAVTLDAAAKLPAFRKPVLLAWASEDRFFPPALAERLAAVLPDARLEWIEDSYTFVSEDQPARLAALLAEFAGTQSAGKVPAGTSPG
jgi:pimeloyl-ACP methyl ester carboxylesterase